MSDNNALDRFYAHIRDCLDINVTIRFTDFEQERTDFEEFLRKVRNYVVLRIEETDCPGAGFAGNVDFLFEHGTVIIRCPDTLKIMFEAESDRDAFGRVSADIFGELLGIPDCEYLFVLNEEEEVYIIQNKYTRNYLQKSHKKIICMFDYYNNTNKIMFKFSLFKMFEEVEFKKEYVDIVEDEPIDVVMKYIDLSDKDLNRTGIHQIKKDEDCGELRYSVRSILQYIPWVRKIFIIMPNEKVKFFKPIDEIKEKIVYIKDKDLMGFDCANIYAFIFNFYKLKQFGVTDNFIYMDDDYYIGKEFNKSDFFYYDDKERKVLPSIINYYFSEFNRAQSKNTYNKLINNIDKMGPQTHLAWKLSIASTETFLLDLYKDQRLIYTEFTHNALPMNINDLKEIFQVIQKYKYINETLYSIERSIYTLLTQYFYCLYNLNIKHRKVHSILNKYYQIEKLNPKDLNAPLFVVNTGGDIIVEKKKLDEAMRIIQQRFPNPTKYEIEYFSNDSSKNFINDNLDNKDKIKNENKYSKLKFYIQYFLILVVIVILVFFYYFGKNEKLKYKQIINSE